ncbi:tetraacyldisaccharide 4'-kinase [Sulfurimonas sp. HSL3-7]|uniref:tetraacyldisaccharide 4'-kinase n=1 Tax=Sulfonitrofixus jiaomeiensis TaxID=3131938 RepID=UPI0031FA0F69
MKQGLILWGERYFYAPGPMQRLLSLLLWPLSLLYCGVVNLRYRMERPRDFKLPIISVGNLTVGGSGKTPIVTALAARYDKVAVVLRGYGRKSRGLVLVSDGKKILVDVDESGDEAMLYATVLPRAVVIVSEKRESAIEKAKEMGCQCLFLDDGYNKHQIKKLDILIEVETKNNFCLPAGPYRERLWRGKKALMIKENREFRRKVALIDASEKMVLVTAIARAERLDPYLPDVADKIYFEDHHYFTKKELESVLERTGAQSLLVTLKDYVKIRKFDLPVSLMELSLELSDDFTRAVDTYISEQQ